MYWKYVSQWAQDSPTLTKGLNRTVVSHKIVKSDIFTLERTLGKFEAIERERVEVYSTLIPNVSGTTKTDILRH